MKNNQQKATVSKIMTRTSTFNLSCLQTVLIDSLMKINPNYTKQSLAQKLTTTTKHELFNPFIAPLFATDVTSPMT